MELPFSAACERNKGPIYTSLIPHISSGNLLEMGFGTAQHCSFMAPLFPELVWYGCDQRDYHHIFRVRTKHLSNVKGPYELWVGNEPFYGQLLRQGIGLKFDYFFTANTLHIMGPAVAEVFCHEVASILALGGLIFIYGPFKFQSKFTSQSNAEFDRNLKEKNKESGLCDFELIEHSLAENSIYMKKCYDLPAHNHLLVFQSN